jgi:hypothetical protein
MPSPLLVYRGHIGADIPGRLKMGQAMAILPNRIAL